MKMHADHYAVLRDAFASIAPKIKAHRDAVIAEARASDVDMRTRWDALYALGKTSALPVDFCKVLYAYLNDDHIDTALRAILREIETNETGEP